MKRDDDETFRLAISWIKICKSDHESCQKEADLATIFTLGSLNMIHDIGIEDWMPRRILDLGAIHPATPNKIRLIRSTQTPKPIKLEYVALSHRWGDKVVEQCRTLRSNLAIFSSDGILLESLPKLFADAVFATRKLGYRYLWIDSLCIVQDDIDEWRAEAPRMATVYSHCAVAIAATRARDSRSSLFEDGHPDSMEIVPTDVADHLKSRKWVLQERILAPRTISFHHDGSLHWECRECDVHFPNSPEISPRPNPTLSTDPCTGEGDRLIAQVGPESEETYEPSRSPPLPPPPTHPKDLFTFFRDFRLPGREYRKPPNSPGRNWLTFDHGTSSDNKDDYIPYLRAWWSFVSNTSPLALSYESDKLFTLNGVVSISQGHIQLRNTWGLWKPFLESELLWSVVETDEILKEPEPEDNLYNPRPWLAPSWSWLKVSNRTVVNDRWIKYYPAIPISMIKPHVFEPVNTGFDQSLPMTACSWKYYSIQMLGDLRQGTIRVVEDGEVYVDNLGQTRRKRRYIVELEPTGRFSHNEIHEFRPDGPIQTPCEVQCFLVMHYEKADLGGDHYVDIRLVLQHAGRENMGSKVSLTVDKLSVEERDLMRPRDKTTTSAKEVAEHNDSQLFFFNDVHAKIKASKSINHDHDEDHDDSANDDEDEDTEQNTWDPNNNPHNNIPASLGGDPNNEERIFRRIGYLETRYEEPIEPNLMFPEDVMWRYIDLR